MVLFPIFDLLYLCFVEFNQLEMLARIVLPSEIFSCFSVVSIELTVVEIYIHLDELMNPELSRDAHFESNGFVETISVTDFPIRDYKVVFRIRRCHWTDIRIGKNFSIPINFDTITKIPVIPKRLELFLKSEPPASGMRFEITHCHSAYIGIAFC